MHSWNCPDDYEARRKAHSDAEFDIRHGSGRYDYRSPFDCDEGNQTYRREYEREAERIEEERADERRRERQREEQRQEEYWAEQQACERAQQEAEEEAYWAEQYAASAMSAGTAETPQEAQGEARQRDGEAGTPND